MNKWNRLLAMLDAVFGFENKIKSNFKKIGQSFDQKTNEHVIVIEYRVRTKDTMNTTPSKRQVDQATLLQRLYAQAQAEENKGKKK